MPRASFDLRYNAVLCRYNEIATKGKNRRSFEQCLIASLRRRLSGLDWLRVRGERGRIFLTAEDGRTFGPAECRDLAAGAPFVFGLASLSPGVLVQPTLPEIERAVEETFPVVYEAFAAAQPGPGPIRYAMRARRSGRPLGMTSKELEILFAERLLPRYPRLKVDLATPDLRVDVEVRQERAFVSYERIPGPGGLPTGTGGRLVAFLSGGIDSPVACYRMMKRGCPLVFVTFHSAPYTPPGTTTKVAELVRILNRYQRPEPLTAVNLLPAQKVIRDTCNERFRTLLYRRLMVRLGVLIAHWRRALGLVTGENLGQVASQTLPNLGVIAEAACLPIFRPLIANDKVETVAVAERIGTLPISNQPMPDSCTVFAPRRPATGADVARVKGEEEKLDMAALLRECVAGTRQIDPETFEETATPKLAAILETALADGTD